jgi:membrane associated rhomboid family serine protease
VSWLLHSCYCIVFPSARSVLNMLICLVKVSRKFSYFSEYFFYFQKFKIYFLRYLKTFSKVLNMFFEFIGCQIMSRNFPRIFGAFEIFSSIKNNFSLFLKLLLILKMG